MSHFVAIKKIDGSQVVLNLDRVVSVELIPSKGSPYYAVTDTNNRVHLLDADPLATKAHATGMRGGMKATVKEVDLHA